MNIFELLKFFSLKFVKFIAILSLNYFLELSAVLHNNFYVSVEFEVFPIYFTEFIEILLGHNLSSAKIFHWNQYKKFAEFILRPKFFSLKFWIYHLFQYFCFIMMLLVFLINFDSFSRVYYLCSLPCSPCYFPRYKGVNCKNIFFSLRFGLFSHIEMFWNFNIIRFINTPCLNWHLIWQNLVKFLNFS